MPRCHFFADAANGRAGRNIRSVYKDPVADANPQCIFDIGVAGPIAGFIALLPVAIAAYATMSFGSTHDIQAGNISPITFSEPLIIEDL